MWSNSIRRCVFFISVIFCGLCTSAGAAIIPVDSSHVQARQPDPKVAREVISDNDYVYDRTPPPESLWDQFINWISDLIGRLFEKGGFLGFSGFTIVLLIAALFVAILLLRHQSVRGMFYGKSASVPVEFREFGEDIHELNFNVLIAQAVAEKDFRKAIRLQFLRLLKELSDKGHIRWQIDKTNFDYYMELSDKQFRNGFRELSLLYEYIWYGDFKATEKQYSESVEKFKSFQL